MPTPSLRLPSFKPSLPPMAMLLLAAIAGLAIGLPSHGLYGATCAEGAEITVSVGVTELRAEDAPETWIKRANGALRNAKDEGRNRVMVAA